MADRRVSYAQNGEDVVLQRALGHVGRGTYVDVGANHPVIDSVTHALVLSGWTGIDVEPVPAFATRLRAARPDNHVVEALVSSSGAPEASLYEVVGTGLSTMDRELAQEHRQHGFEVREIDVPVLPLSTVAGLPGARDEDGQTHLLKIDVEGAEADVLRSVDLLQWRPWVVVVEATKPLTAEPSHEEWEPDLLAAGYRFCLFDGLSRFYVAEEHAHLAPALSYPACPQDDYVRREEVELREQVQQLTGSEDQRRHELDALRTSLLTWRRQAVVEWAGGAQWPDRDEVELARHHVAVVDRELEAMRASVSWRVTRPLRAVRRLGRGPS